MKQQTSSKVNTEQMCSFFPEWVEAIKQTRTTPPCFLVLSLQPENSRSVVEDLRKQSAVNYIGLSSA